MNDDIDEAEKLLKLATNGAWWRDGRSIKESSIRHEIVCEMSGGMRWAAPDGDLIVHLRNHAPGWLAELRALRKLRDAVDVYLDSDGAFADGLAVLAALREAQQHGGAS